MVEHRLGRYVVWREHTEIMRQQVDMEEEALGQAVSLATAKELSAVVGKAQIGPVSQELQRTCTGMLMHFIRRSQSNAFKRTSKMHITSRFS
jgi:hypothetical protein